ncbi:thiopeptide-type bacteriocin biosynthesis protein [Nocardioides sp. NPDC057772]|uniref:thiopeptide-type bacteriocin biosynthesis protein n=1 Tax=Nocardioides sp. NPDC057772 TaxID=3346245 RepID=UPI003670999A
MTRTANLEQAVLAILGGRATGNEAERVGLPAEHLRELADSYRAAGRTVLEPGAENWVQVNITFPDYGAAEIAMLDAVWPALRQLDIDRWWFLRKRPHWRLRLRPAADTTKAGILDQVAAAFEPIVSRRFIENWSIAHYEPETTAFGGPQGMCTVHDIFHADSNGYLEFRKASQDKTDESPDPLLVSLLITTHMFRAAGIETTEHGDVWARVVDQRPPVPPGPDLTSQTAKASAALRVDLRELTATDPRFTSAEAWAMNLDECGRRVGELWRAGAIDAGLRGILARVVIFHWNRIGLHVRQQSLLAAAARDAALGGTE